MFRRAFVPVSNLARLAAVLVTLLSSLSVVPALAATCTVVHRPPPTDAEKALLSGDFPKAADLFKAALDQHPADPELITGLVHALLRQQKVQDADAVIQAAIAKQPQSVPLMAVLSEVEFREGTPWLAAETVNKASSLDPCNPQVHLVYAKIARVSSLYASAQKQILTAHQLDPDDPEIREEWIQTLPTKQRIAELANFLSGANGQDADDLRDLRMYLDHLKHLADEPHQPCRLVSTTESTEIPFAPLMYDATHVRAYGLDVKLNNRNARLQIDTGAGGLLVSRSVADRAGLKSFSKTSVGGIGDHGEKAGYTAFADSIRIGNLEFHNCAVEVLDSRNVMDDSDGLIGMDVLSHFLVTLDYPMRKLVLGPLPKRPGQMTAAAPELKTDEGDSDDPEASPDPAKPSAPPAANPSQTPAPTPATNEPSHGPYDRYIAPEMKDYTPVYRVGHDLILPAALNRQKLKLFIMDTGAWTTSISPQAAREVTKVRGDEFSDVRGLSGRVDKVYSADQITFVFAHISQKVEGVASFDTSRISKYVGMEISGFIGATTLSQCTIHIDYRDGLVKFDYNPLRGYR